MQENRDQAWFSPRLPDTSKSRSPPTLLFFFWILLDSRASCRTLKLNLMKYTSYAIAYYCHCTCTLVVWRKDHCFVPRKKEQYIEYRLLKCSHSNRKRLRSQSVSFIPYWSNIVAMSSSNPYSTPAPKSKQKGGRTPYKTPSLPNERAKAVDLVSFFIFNVLI